MGEHEEWRSTPTWPDYEATRGGSVRRVRDRNGVPLAEPHVLSGNSRGGVILSAGGRSRCVPRHEVAADAWGPAGGGGMNAREFAGLVERMRAAQRRYFRDRAHTSLEESKRLEREVDSALREILDEQPRLFGAEDPR